MRVLPTGGRVAVALRDYQAKRVNPPPPTIERFSFECRKVIGFALATLHDWLKKLAPIFHPIRSKTKTNRDSLARVFLRFASATCIKLLRVLIGSLYCVCSQLCDWLE